MLITLTLSTFYRYEKTEYWRRCRSDERRSKKNRKKRKIFQNKCVSSQQIRMRKEEGATVAASPLTFAAGCFEVCHRLDRQRFPWKHSTLQESPIKYHKSTRIETPAIFSLNWLTNEHSFRTKLHQTDEQQIKQKMQLNLTERSDLNIRK